MRARLQRDIERRAARGLAGFVERASFGVRPTARPRDAAADDDALVEQKGADGRIGRGETERAPTEGERSPHPALVFRRLAVHRGERRSVADSTAGGSGSTAGGSGSASSSPRIVLKSRASRKFR